MKPLVLIGGVAVTTAAVAVGFLFFSNDLPGFGPTDSNQEEVAATGGGETKDATPAEGAESPTPSIATTSDKPEAGTQLSRAPVADIAQEPVDSSKQASPVTGTVVPLANEPVGELAEDVSGTVRASAGASPASELATAPIGQPGGHLVAGAAAPPEITVDVSRAEGGSEPAEQLAAGAIERPIDHAEAPQQSETGPLDLAVEGREPVADLVSGPVSDAGLAAPYGASEANAPETGPEPDLAREPSTASRPIETGLSQIAVEKLASSTEPVVEPVASGAGGETSSLPSESIGAVIEAEVVGTAVDKAGAEPVSGPALASEIVTTSTPMGTIVIDDPVVDQGMVSPVESPVGSETSALAPQIAAVPSASAGVEAPRFDVVRVDVLGNTVIAGRSSPRCEITVRGDDEVIGVTVADRRGEWVLLPIEPLSPGDRQLSLHADCGAAGHASSERVVIVVVPEPGTDIAGRPSGKPADVLALSVPRSGSGRSRVLQAPIAEGAASASDGVPPDVSLTAIDYGNDGQLSLSGEAAPGASLNVYLDNTLVGSATTGAEGEWTVSPEAPVAPGLYTLRADQVADTGKVEARVEVPFLRAEPLTDLPDDQFVVVVPGNSLWRIARRTYGQGIQYTVIYQANAEQIRDPDLIYPGQIFMLPQAN